MTPGCTVGLPNDGATDLLGRFAHQLGNSSRPGAGCWILDPSGVDAHQLGDDGSHQGAHTRETALGSPDRRIVAGTASVGTYFNV